MDSQHRHELKTNELAEGLKHLPGLLKDNANTIIGIILIGDCRADGDNAIHPDDGPGCLCCFTGPG
jgi:hypothetical protein